MAGPLPLKTGASVGGETMVGSAVTVGAGELVGETVGYSNPITRSMKCMIPLRANTSPS
jgi:hypothetical protein